jgi:prepilin-type N-terminal cleavage/methylation domain-containing protein
MKDAVRRTRGAQDGYTFVEVLVALTVFSAVSAGIFGVMISATRSSETTRRVAGVSEQARLGLNRMVRDTREGSAIDSVAADRNSFEVHVDFDGNNAITPLPDTNSLGDFEELTYSFDPATKTLRLNGEVLVSGVECARDSSNDCRSISRALGSSLKNTQMWASSTAIPIVSPPTAMLPVTRPCPSTRVTLSPPRLVTITAEPLRPNWATAPPMCVSALVAGSL